MITPTMIYWIGQCDCIRSACGPITVVGIILSVATIVITIVAFGDRSISRLLCWMGVALSSIFCVVSIIGILGQVFIPTSKTAASMYVIPAIVNNEKVQDAGNQLYELAVSWMEELRPRHGKQGSGAAQSNEEGAKED